MSRLRIPSRPSWVLAGIVIGAVVVPAVAFAAGAQLVTIRGNDHNASVSPAGQLRTTAMDPSNMFHAELPGGVGNCAPLYTVPANRSAMLRHINVSTIAFRADLTDPVSSNPLVTITTGACGAPASTLGIVRITEEGLVSIPLGDGIPLPAGTQVNETVTSKSAALIDAYGYTMAENAVPATAAAIHRTGPARVTVPRAKGR